MQGMVILFRVMQRLEIDGIPEEFAGFNRKADAGKNLKNDAAGTDVGMADFGVAHLAFRQTDIQAGRLQLGVREAGKKRIQIRFAGSGNGIARRRRSNAEAIHDDQAGAVSDICFHTLLIPAPSPRR